ncbi:MAG: hydrolase [Ramlibacter sp.]|nr:hydrolase [Ramlibacter sp.]
MNPQMILVAGPYRSGTNDDPVLIERNVHAMTEASLHLFRAGHLPVMGEWFALPLITHAGSTGIGDAIFNEIFHPVSRRLVAQCDGCLRIGGPSAGADEMVALARKHGKALYFSLDEIPHAAGED